MRNAAAIAAAIAGLGLAACGVGDSDDASGDTTAGRRLCSYEYSVAGTYTLGPTAPPDRTIQRPDEPPDADPKLDGTPGSDGIPDIQGCWPVGTWTFQLTPTGGDCDPQPELPSEITFVADFIDHGPNVEPTYEYELVAPFNYSKCIVGSTGNCAIVRVDQGGSGLCEGSVELFGPGGTDVFLIQPVLSEIYQATSPLTGSAEFGHFEDQQLPEGDPPAAGCSAASGNAGLLGAGLAALLLRRRRTRRV